MTSARARLVVALASAHAFLVATGTAAQQSGSFAGRPPPAGGDAYLQRQVRTLERAGSAPGSAILLRRAERDLIGQSRGVFLSPEQARVRRDLDRIGREQQPARLSAEGGPAPALPRGDRLPGSVVDDAALPSLGASTTLTRLVGRAEAALAEGRTNQARSDLATARSLSAGAGPAGLEARMTALERRLDEGG